MANSDDEAWRVAIAGLLALAVAMGIGRFAFTPLLPLMLRDGEVTLVGGGALASANYLGYFVGALLCTRWQREAAPTVRAGLVATVALTLAMGAHWGSGLATDVLHPLWLVLRAAAGVASAVVFVFVSGWCLQRLGQLERSDLGGIIFCGPGLGIVVTGLAAGPMAARGWPAAAGWLAFGVLAALLVAVLWRTLRGGGVSKRAASAGATMTAETTWLAAAYGLAGFGYIITATFLPVMARSALPGSAWPDYFWPVFGGAVALGAFIATRVGVTHDNRTMLAWAFALQSCGVLLGVVWPTVVGLALSSLLAGLPFTAITLFAMRESRRLRSHDPAPLMGWLTATYGAGQIAGPPLATALHRSGGFAPSLLTAAGALALGALAFLYARRRWPA
ncbi:MAG: YbfB/YjiJ family MFS transporter [Proteobacteria bacterium]|nr:YbfB/YjiJ family MFS transporter [Pseudomonadota bacterium]